MRRPIHIHVVLAWAASLIVHGGGVAAALLQYYSQPETKPDIPVMELVHLPVIVAPPAPAPQPPQPRKPPPVARPKRVEPVVAEHIEPAPPVESVAQVEPPPIVQATAGPVPVTPEPEPVVDLKAAYLENPRPAYPEVARRRGWEGTVIIHLMLDEDGLPHGLRIQNSSGFDVLDRAALVSVQEWRFRPATRNGEAVAMPSVLVPIQFRLKN